MSKMGRLRNGLTGMRDRSELKRKAALQDLLTETPFTGRRQCALCLALTDLRGKEFHGGWLSAHAGGSRAYACPECCKSWLLSDKPRDLMAFFTGLARVLKRLTKIQAHTIVIESLHHSQGFYVVTDLLQSVKDLYLSLTTPDEAEPVAQESHERGTENVESSEH